MSTTCPWCRSEVPDKARLCKECNHFVHWRYYALPSLRGLGIALLVPLGLLLLGNIVTNRMETAAREEARRKEANLALQDLVEAVRAYRAGGVMLATACVGHDPSCRDNLYDAVVELDAAYAAFGQTLAPFDHFVYEQGDDKSVFTQAWMHCHVVPYFGSQEEVSWEDAHWNLALEVFDQLDACRRAEPTPAGKSACDHMAHEDLKAIYWYVASGRCVNDQPGRNRSLSWFQREAHRQIYGVQPVKYPGKERLGACAQLPCTELQDNLQLRRRVAGGD
jgi:hypothetical protein